MKLISPAFNENDLIPIKYSCEGEGASPPLEIYDAPDDTVSFAIVVQDPDSPSGDFVHWLIWNIDPSLDRIGENTTPIGAVEGTSDFGEIKWGGPCPHKGMHRYEFHLYALKQSLNLSPGAGKDLVREEIRKNLLQESTLVGLYEKQHAER